MSHPYTPDCDCARCVKEKARSAQRELSEIPADLERVRFVGWQCGCEPLFVAVWSCLPGVSIDTCDAEGLARVLLIEKGWFDGEPTDADYIL